MEDELWGLQGANIIMFEGCPKMEILAARSVTLEDRQSYVRVTLL